MAKLVDVNVLVALMHARHRHSERAVRWLENQTADGSVLVCRVTQTGVLRLLTQPVMMKEDMLSAHDFWRGWARLIADDRFRFAAEPAGLESSWKEITRTFPKGRCAETDVFLAAFAVSGGWTLATFDRGFRRFPTVRAEIL